MTKFAVLGATGECGREVARQLCLLRVSKPELVEKVVLYGRRDLSVEDAFHAELRVENADHDEKLKKLQHTFTDFVKQERVDYDDLENNESFLKDFSTCFCCLGTTYGKAGAEGQRKVDFDYVVNSAQRASNYNVGKFIVISSTSANPKSMYFYMRLKGETEMALRKLRFNFLGIFKPGFLRCDRREKRVMEGALHLLMRMDLWNYSSIKTSDVAAGLVEAAILSVDEALAAGKVPHGVDTDHSATAICEFPNSNILQLSQRLKASMSDTPVVAKTSFVKKVSRSLSNKSKSSTERFVQPKQTDVPAELPTITSSVA